MIPSTKKSFIVGFILGAIAGWATSKIPYILVFWLLVYTFIAGVALGNTGYFRG